MSHYDMLTERGDPRVNRAMFLYLYPNSGGARTDAKNDVHDGFVDAADQLYNENVIHYYGVAIYKDDLGITHSTESEFQTRFDNWVQGHCEECDSEWLGHPCDSDIYPCQDFLNRKGVHCGVSTKFDFASGHQNGSAFTTGQPVWIGTAGASDKVRNFGAQEPLHTFINHNIPDVEAMLDDSTHMHEHDLGQISWNRSVSPMATLYEFSHADHGDCWTSYDWDGTYDTTLAQCTKDAVDATAEWVL